MVALDLLKKKYLLNLFFFFLGVWELGVAGVGCTVEVDVNLSVKERLV